MAARAVVARVAPNHGGLTDEYRDLAATAGLRTDIDPALVADIVQGALLRRLVSTGAPPDGAIVDRLVDILLGGLREPAAG